MSFIEPVRKHICSALESKSLGNKDFEKDLDNLVLSCSDPKVIKDVYMAIDPIQVISLLQSCQMSEKNYSNTCKLLGYLLSELEPQKVLTQFHEPLCLVIGQQSAPTALLLICINQIERAVDAGSSQTVLSMKGIWPEILNLFKSEEISVANAVGRVFQKIASKSTMLICSDECTRHMETLYSHSNSTSRVRIIETLVMCNQAEVYNAYNALIDNILFWLNGNDILVKVTAFDILVKMSTTAQGFKYIIERSLLQRIQDLIINSTEDDVFGELLVTNGLLCVGKLCQNNPSQFYSIQSQKELIEIIMKQLDKSPQISEAAVTALGLLGSSQEGAMYLQGMSLWMRVCKRFNQPNKTPEVRIAYLRMFGAIFATSLPELESLYAHLGKVKGLKEFTKDAMNSIKEIKSAGFCALRGLAKHQFAVKDMLSDSVWTREFLLNRSTENTHLGHVAKYDLIKEIHLTAKPMAIDEETMTLLDDYLKKGEFYAKATANIALKSE